MIKLFVCDIDDTLLNRHVGLPLENLNAILELQRQGIVVALASGRVVPGVIKLAETLQLSRYNGFIIAANGSYVQSMKDGKILLDKRIDLVRLQEMAALIETLGIHCSIQQGDQLFYIAEDEALLYDRDVIGLKVEKHPDLSTHLFESANKVEVTGWSQVDGQRLEVFIHHYQTEFSLIKGQNSFLDVMPKDVTKASGLAVVMNALQLRSAEVAAIGDGENDRHMLKAAGLSATLANADYSLQSDVDYVVGSVEQAGLAHFAQLVLLKNAN